jgi:DNA-binding response OmpR family regulator
LLRKNNAKINSNKFIAMKRILMIEDDPSIIELAGIHLKDIHCELTEASNGFEGLHLASTNSYDAIILDIMLPDINGIEICKRLRAEKNFTPIIMLTARSEEIDKIIGLETGADDYLTKPFSIREFTARVKALIRRSELNNTDSTPVDEVIKFGKILIDTQKRKVMLDEVKIDLTPKEFDLLYLFMSNPGISYSRETLLNLVWGYEFSGYEHTVNSHINRLRTKIEHNLTNPKYILTTWGIGYRFTDEIK